MTHDWNIHHVAYFGDNGIQIAANYDRTRFIENKKLSTMKNHFVIIRQAFCWPYEFQFNANLNRNIFFSLEILRFNFPASISVHIYIHLTNEMCQPVVIELTRFNIVSFYAQVNVVQELLLLLLSPCE